MNDGNPIKPKIKQAIYRFQKKRYEKLVLHEGDQVIHKNPSLGEKALTAEEIQAVQDQWSGLRMPVSAKWHQIYKNLLGSFDPRMIPMTIFYLRFEPYLTDHRLVKGYADKNAHHLFIPDANRPELILQHVHRRFYGRGRIPLTKSEVESYLQNQEGSFFLKPAMDGNGGRFLTTFQVKKGLVLRKGEPITVDELLKPYPQNFLIQRKVEQHADIQAIYPTSVNTFRVTTIREGHTIRVLNNILRMGHGGSEIDNIKQGGIVLGIYEGGRSSDQALDGSLHWIDRHPDTGMVFSDLKPFSFVEKIEKEAVRLHENFPYADLICWDIACDKEGRVVVIEYNLRGFTVLLQQAFHGPLFGDQTDEWIEKMRKVWKDADHQTGYYPAFPKL